MKNYTKVSIYKLFLFKQSILKNKPTCKDAQLHLWATSRVSVGAHGDVDRHESHYLIQEIFYLAIPHCFFNIFINCILFSVCAVEHVNLSVYNSK